jgi:hypothetical protein
MRRFFITVANCVLLAVVLVGVPEVAGERFWDWRISSVPVMRTLTLWGLALAAAANAGAALFLIKGGKERKLCWEWAAIFGALLGAECAFVRGWFNFDWLKQTLLWLQKKF